MQNMLFSIFVIIDEYFVGICNPLCEKVLFVSHHTTGQVIIFGEAGFIPSCIKTWNMTTNQMILLWAFYFGSPDIEKHSF